MNFFIEFDSLDTKISFLRKKLEKWGKNLQERERNFSAAVSKVATRSFIRDTEILLDLLNGIITDAEDTKTRICNSDAVRGQYEIKDT